MNSEPKSLQEAIVYFSNPDNCIDYLAIRRWPDGRVICPTCGSDKVKFNPARRLWQCSTHHPKRQFSIKVGTVMEDSAIPLDKWMTATWMVTNCKNGVSSYEIARDVKVTQKSAWFMLHRIRLAMQDETLGSKSLGKLRQTKLSLAEKARNMHKSVKARRITGQGQTAHDKIIVMGMLERGGRVRAKLSRIALRPLCIPSSSGTWKPETALFTDELGGYRGLETEYEHQVIDHAVNM